MIWESYIPRIPGGLIRGMVEGYHYFFNPRGRFGAIVLFGKAFEVLKKCDGSRTVGEIQNILPWAMGDSDRFKKILVDLKNRDFIDFGDVPVDDPYFKPKRIKKKEMMVWLQLTDMCNLCCGYCYIHKKPTQMNPLIAKRLVSAIIRDSYSAGFDIVVFKLAGGEPTLNWRVGKELIDWTRANFSGVAPLVRFHIITNGTILPRSLLEYLRDGKLGISLSLDGVEEWHNKQRYYRDGSGSFMDIDKTITTLINAGISPQILTTVTDVNVDGLTELSKYCIDRDLNFRFSFFRDVINSPAELVNNNARLIRELKRCYEWIGGHLPKKSLYVCHRFGDMNLQVPKVRGCGVGVNGMTVASDGKVSTCQYEMSNSLGNALRQNSVSLILKEGKYELAESHVDKTPDCRECEWRYTCGGGCAFQTKYNYGTFRHASSYCEVYKAILPVLVELHALQLVREFQKGVGDYGRVGNFGSGQ